jgi:hypothetical protein
MVLVMLVLSLILGGGSRIELLGPVLLRCISVGLLTWFFWPGFGEVKTLSLPVRIFVAAVLALPLVQLIPLPWSVWTQLPGRGMAKSVYDVIETQPWQPLSLTPERTFNTFMALLPPLAAFFIATRLDDKGATRLWLVMALAASVSALIGVLQVLGGENSRLYFYNITNSDSSVGFFANANHQALFLCAGIIAAFRWASLAIAAKRQTPKEPVIIAVLMVLTILVSLPVTLSRAGLGMSVVAIAVGLSFVGPQAFNIDPKLFKRGRLAVVAIVVAGLAAVALMGGFGGSGEDGVAADARLRALPTMLAIAGQMFPIGSGFGSFDAVFRSQETIATIGPTYLNHAHNDLLQIVIEAGLGAVVLAALFVVWWARRTFELWRTPEGRGATIKHGRAASAIIGLALAHSLVDYPLRTPAMAVIVGLCAAIMMGVAVTYNPERGTRPVV